MSTYDPIDMPSHALPPLGAYVLATQYTDGDPGDHWAVGFYVGPGPRPDRHQVVDGTGTPMRANGFARVAMIRPEVGAWLLASASSLTQAPPGSVTLWGMLTPPAFADAVSSTRPDAQESL